MFKVYLLSIVFIMGSIPGLAQAKTCPSQKLCDVLGETLDTCEQDKRQCTDFVATFEKLLPKYDCKKDPKAKGTISAILLCGEYEDALRFLSKMKADDAKKIFGSPQLRAILDGDLKEEFSELSIKVGKENAVKETLPVWLAPRGFDATAAQRKEVEAWFAKYDELSLKNDIEAMATQARFPLYAVTHDSKGQAHTEIWKKEDFMQIMKEATAGTPKDLEMRTERTPYFLSDDLIVVTTRATVKSAGKTNVLKYADVLVKDGGVWKFQTMVQAGWGDLLKTRKK